MRFGIISTGMISGEFTRALQQTPEAEITAVQSRNLENAQAFIEDHQLSALAFTSVEELCASEQIDAVYIASPNSLHASHALTAISAGKHVVVEKPAVWNPAQWDQVFAAAQQAKVLVFEAARHIYEPAHEIIRQALASQTPATVRMNFSQYSSRWDAVLAGEEPNIFSLKFGGGALVDLGIYPVYNAVSWFGEPDGINYYPAVAPTGVDSAGTLILTYEDFNVIITIAKNAHSTAPSEILLGKETIRFSSCAGIDRVTRYSKDSEEVLFDSGAEIGSRPLSELMRDEAAFFTEMLSAFQQGTQTDEQVTTYRRLTLLSRSVNEICTQARNGAGIFFEGETTEF